MSERRAPYRAGHTSRGLLPGESTLQEWIRRFCVLRDHLYYHTHRSEHSPAGFPDGVILVKDARAPRLVFEESKAANGQPSPEQYEWLYWLNVFREYLESCGVPKGVFEVRLWRPQDWPAIERVLGEEE